MPTGAVLKCHAIYDQPFWRGDGLTGQSAAPGTAAAVTLDACGDAAELGLMFVINEGPDARKLTAMDPADRQAAIVAALTERFGDKAGKPIDFTQQDWTVVRYSGGGMISHAPPGVLTEFGPALRRPCGRIDWAGTESSSVMLGFVDGAVRSGERAADEVVANDSGASSGAAPVLGQFPAHKPGHRWVRCYRNFTPSREARRGVIVRLIGELLRPYQLPVALIFVVMLVDVGMTLAGRTWPR
jgi:hypothetical protein